MAALKLALDGYAESKILGFYLLLNVFFLSEQCAYVNVVTQRGHKILGFKIACIIGFSPHDEILNIKFLKYKVLFFFVFVSFFI